MNNRLSISLSSARIGLRAALLTACVFMCAPASAAAEEPLAYTVVAASSVKADGFDKDALARVFLGRTRSVNGVRVSVAVLPYKTPAIKAFLDEVVSMSPRRFESYWRKRLFSSRGTPPRVIATENELLALVARAPGTIAVVPAETMLPEGVHVVAFPPPPPAAAPATAPPPPVTPPPAAPATVAPAPVVAPATAAPMTAPPPPAAAPATSAP